MVYPAAVVVGANPVNVADVAVLLVGLIVTAVPSKLVIWNVYGSIPLLIVLTVIVPLLALLQVTLVNASTVSIGCVALGTVIGNTLLHSGPEVLLSKIVIT